MSADLPGPWRPTHSFVPPPGLPVWVWGKGGKWGNIQVAWVVETRHGWKWGDGVVIREPSMFPAWCFLYELPVPDFAETKYKKGEPMPVDQPAPDAVARMPKWKRDYLSRCFGVSMENEKEAPAPDALAALREAMTKSADVDWETHDLRYGSLAQRLLPAVLDELERLRAAEKKRERDRQEKLRDPLEEVATFPNGYTLYRRPDEVGGRDYFSDEVGGGVHVWNTSLVSPETLRAALAAEEKEKS